MCRVVAPLVSIETIMLSKETIVNYSEAEKRTRIRETLPPKISGKAQSSSRHADIPVLIWVSERIGDLAPIESVAHRSPKLNNLSRGNW